MYSAFLLVNMGINKAYGISFCPVSCKYYSIRNIKAAYAKNCVNSKLAWVLNRNKKCTLKDNQLEQSKRKQQPISSVAFSIYLISESWCSPRRWAQWNKRKPLVYQRKHHHLSLMNFIMTVFAFHSSLLWGKLCCILEIILSARTTHSV